MKNTIVAICYDFDNTLSVMDMQSYGLIPAFGLTPNEFWQKNQAQVKKLGVTSVLSYLRLIIDECEKNNITLTRKFLNDCGKSIEYHNGVRTWFKRLNEYAASRGITLEHYIISSGNKEILEGSEIYKEFKNVFGCEYLYDRNGVAYWPKNIIDFTVKTQYLFKINKGIGAKDSESKVNERIEEKHVEFRNMIYIGDGYTDIPCMTLVREKGGTSISVYTDETKTISDNLVRDDRVNYACKADYSAGSELDKLLKLMIDSISLREKLFKKENNR